MTTQRRQRFSRIPVLSRTNRDVEEVLLRVQPDWKDKWYFPSMTRDGSMPAMSEMLDMVSEELSIPRQQLAAKPLPVWTFYQELSYQPSEEAAEYVAKVVDLSLQSESVPDLEFVSHSGRRYRWVAVSETRLGRTSDGDSVAPAVWDILELLRTKWSVSIEAG